MLAQYNGCGHRVLLQYPPLNFVVPFPFDQLIPRVTHCEPVRMALISYHAMPQMKHDPYSEPLRMPHICPVILDTPWSRGNVLVDQLHGMCYDCQKAIAIQGILQRNAAIEEERRKHELEPRIITPWARQQLDKKAAEDAKKMYASLEKMELEDKNIIQYDKTHVEICGEVKIADKEEKKDESAKDDSIVNQNVKNDDVSEHPHEATLAKDEYFYAGPIILRPLSTY